MPRRYSLTLAPTAYACLRRIRDGKLLGEIAKAIDGLAEEPAEQGRPLDPPLEGVHSARAARERYRILYEIDDASANVSVLFVGKRRPGSESDVYATAARLLAVLLQK